MLNSFILFLVVISCDPVLSSLEKQWIAEDQLKSVGMSITFDSESSRFLAAECRSTNLLRCLTSGCAAADSIMEGGKDIAAVKQAHRATRATCWNLLVN